MKIILLDILKVTMEDYYRESRKLIIKSLSKNNMNTYFYAPKEDIYHRLFGEKIY